MTRALALVLLALLAVACGAGEVDPRLARFERCAAPTGARMFVVVSADPLDLEGGGDFAPALEEAAAQWTCAVGHDIRVRHDEPALEEPGFRIRVRSGWKIAPPGSGEVRFAHYESTEEGGAITLDRYTLRYEAGVLRSSLMLHELGHACGFEHVEGGVMQAPIPSVECIFPSDVASRPGAVPTCPAGTPSPGHG